jgi:precorrin-2/cobalt-factor-2 C20-methyltransferase
VTRATLYGVGVGPGDPELITLRGKRIIETAAVVACPADSTGGPGLAGRIAQHFLSNATRLLLLELPFVLDDAAVADAHRRAAEALASHLAAGAEVAFVAEGDVSMYSTFGYLAAAVRRRLPNVRIEFVPGVTAISAAAAALGAPLVERGQTLAIVPGSRAADRIGPALAGFDAVALLKPAGAWAAVIEQLDRARRRGAANLVEWAGTDRQRIVAGAAFDPADPPHYFSTVVVRADNGRAGD